MTLIVATTVVIGLLLGLLGGGGSILMLPVLVYLAHLSTLDAIVTSLIVVSITSAITVTSFARRQLVCWKTGTTFGIAGMLGAYIGGRLTAFIPEPVLLILFAIIMVASALAMIRKTGPQKDQFKEGAVITNFCPRNLPVSAILFDGVLVGLITGLIGVGGGFLLVPALVLLAGLPMSAAIGTSLLIIVMQSLAALAGHADHIAIDIELTSIIAACAITGSFIGSQLSQKINSYYLKRLFGFFVLFLGLFIMSQEFSVELTEQIQQLVIENQDFLKGAITIVIVLLLYRLWSKLH